MRAVRDNETSAAVSGINLAATKTISFGIASALGGIGGAIYVAEVGIASPDDFSSLVAIYLIVGLVVGGVGTLEGAIVGGLVYALVPDWASSTQSIAFVPERWLQGPTGSLILGDYADFAHSLYARRYRKRFQKRDIQSNTNKRPESP